MKHLPLIMYKIQRYLETNPIAPISKNADGRINNCHDESVIDSSLIDRFGVRIKEQKKRMWSDVLVFDDKCGWLPVNIKTVDPIGAIQHVNIAKLIFMHTIHTTNDANIHLEMIFY